MSAALVAEFSAYLESGTADPPADQVGYRRHAIWLTPDERTKLIDGLRAAILPVLDNRPNGNRTRYLLSPILFPTPDPADDSA